MEKNNFMCKKILVVCLIGFCAFSQARAQLAITEIQTGESKANSLGSAPDWWELKNYGASDIDLTGYSWNDGGHPVQGADMPFTGITIHAGETIIITETNGSFVTSAAAFEQWWGASHFSPNVQIILSSSANGLSKSGEAVRLWQPGATTSTDPNDPNDLVDRVDVGAEPTTGIPTFIYDTNNGVFDIFSTNGVDGAFTAATSTDVGSPGIAPASAPIMITQQPSPASYTSPTNVPASFTVVGYGLPKPKFQWTFNGSPVDTNALGVVIFNSISNNVSFSTLTISAVTPIDGGTFSVVATNGVETVQCSNVVLNVTDNPLAPVITAFYPTNLTAYSGQSVTFTVENLASPTANLQWKFNNTNIDGQTGPQYQVFVNDASQSGIYSVNLMNSAGSTNISASLTVIPKPDLRITEIMSSENASTNNHGDWWELSNFGSQPVALEGYRFDDNSFMLADAYTITNNVTIAPDESIVLCEDETPDEFRAWWGVTNLPADLQIIDYHGGGLSFSGTSGDALTLWNAAAATEGDFIYSVSIAAETNGISFSYDPVAQDFPGTTPDGLSVVGVNGAFAAADGGDIGSPGVVVNSPNSMALTKTTGGFNLSWNGQSDWNYTVQYKTNLTDANWTMLTRFMSGDTNVASYTDITTSPQRFYRVFLNLNNQ